MLVLRNRRQWLLTAILRSGYVGKFLLKLLHRFGAVCLFFKFGGPSTGPQKSPAPFLAAGRQSSESLGFPRMYPCRVVYILRPALSLPPQWGDKSCSSHNSRSSVSPRISPERRRQTRTMLRSGCQVSLIRASSSEFLLVEADATDDPRNRQPKSDIFYKKPSHQRITIRFQIDGCRL